MAAEKAGKGGSGEGGKDAKANGSIKKSKNSGDDKENELSEEDQRLKDDLNLMVERISDPEPGIVANALKARPSKTHRGCLCTPCLTR